MVQIVLEFEILQFHMKINISLICIQIPENVTGAWGMDFVSYSPLFSTTPTLFKQLRGYSQGSCRLQKSYRRTDIKCLNNGRKNLITLKDQTKKMYQSSREICLRKSGVRYAQTIFHRRMGHGFRFLLLLFDLLV
jgi:hypothetical protein